MIKITLSAYGRFLLLSLLLVVSCGAFADVTLTVPEKILLWNDKPLVTPDREHKDGTRVQAVDNPSMQVFKADPAKAHGGAVVIFPGGGYVRLAIEHEGYDIARYFNRLGYTAFVVSYRMKEYGAPYPLLDAQRAVRLVRKQAAAYQIDPHRIGVIGFSAGGHVAGSVATRFDYLRDQEAPQLRSISARPDFAILVYPVITMRGEATHQGSKQALLGAAPSVQLEHDYSLETQVSAKTPPVFIVHGAGDKSVPLANSLDFYRALLVHQPRAELHIYQTAVHGFGLRENEGTASYWGEPLVHWLSANGFDQQKAR